MGELKPGWTRVKFGEVVQLNRETSKDPPADGLERYVGLEHLEPEDLRIRSWGNISDGTTFTNRFRPGHVLFGKRRAYQRKLAVADFDGICSGDIYVFESKDPDVLLPELLPFLCQTDSFFEYAVGTSAGSLSPRTNWKSLALYEFALPPLEEQRRIVRVLGRWGDLVDTLENARLCAEKTRQTMAREIFMNLMQSGVRVSSLAKVCTRKPQSGLYKPKEKYGQGLKMVHMGELFGNDQISSDIAMQLVDVDTTTESRFLLTEHDLLFGRRSVVLEGAGRCVLIDRVAEPMSFESSILRVTVDPYKIDKKYLFEWFRSPEGVQQIKRFVTFTTVAGVKGSDVARLPVPVPSISTQVKIAQDLQMVRETIEHIDLRLHDARRSLSALLNSLFGRN